MFDPAEMLRIQLVDSGITRVTADYDSSWRMLPYADLASVLDRPKGAAGTGRLEFADGRSLAFEPGTSVLIPRNCRHRFTNSEFPHVSVWIHWDVALAGDLDLFQFCQIPPFIRGQASREIAGLCAELHRCGDGELTCGIRRRALLYELLYRILRCCSFRAEYQVFCAQYTEFLPLLNYIDTHLDGALPLDDIARFYGCSVSKLQREFIETFGIAPGGFIARRRMLLATRLLCRKCMTLTEIAERVGFADAFSFSKAFKKMFSLNPTEYRRLQHGTAAAIRGGVLPDCADGGTVFH